MEEEEPQGVAVEVEQDEDVKEDSSKNCKNNRNPTLFQLREVEERRKFVEWLTAGLQATEEDVN